MNNLEWKSWHILPGKLEISHFNSNYKFPTVNSVSMKILIIGKIKMKVLSK